MDPFSYTAPSRVKTLFIPLDNLSPEDFYSYFDSFRANNVIKLSDIPVKSSANDSNVVNKFSPQSFLEGQIVYDHSLTHIDNQEIFLQDFEPFRKIFIVIGVLKYSSKTTSIEKLKSHLKNLRKLFNYSIVHQIFVFDCDNDSLSSLKSSSDQDSNDFVFIQKGHWNSTECYSNLCDISSNFLDALNSYAQSFQHVTLRSPGSINSNEVLKVQKSNHTSIYDEGVGSTITVDSKKSSANPNPNGAPSVEKVKDSKNKGRHCKILGNLYLLAGRLPDALREFGEALTLLKSSNDHLWLGNTLECVSVCLILLSQLNVAYQLPSSVLKFLSSKDKHSDKNTPSGSPRNSISRSNTTDVSNGVGTLGGGAGLEKLNLQVPDIVAQLTNKVLHNYSLTFQNHEDYVPQLVFCEAIVRYLKFMTIIHIGNGFTMKVLNHIVKNERISEKSSNDYFFTKLDIFKFSNRVFTVRLENMSLNCQCRIYCALASIYDDLEFYRKKSYVLRTLFLKVIPEINKKNRSTINAGSNNVEDEEDLELITKSNAIFDKNQQLQTQMELNSKLLIELTEEDSKKFKKTVKNGDEALIKLLNNLALIYGIGVSPNSSTSNYKKTPWFHVHKSVLKLCIDICKTIIDFKGIVFFASILLSKYLNTLSAKEQNELLSLIQETQQKAKNVNFDISCQYWDPFLIRDVNLLFDFDESLLPIKLKHVPKGTNTTIDTPSSKLTKNSVKQTSTFLYNPFEENSKKQAKMKRKSSKRLSSLNFDKFKSADLSSLSELETPVIEESSENPEPEIGAEVEKQDQAAEEEDYDDVVEEDYDDDGILLVQDEILTLLVKVQNPFKFSIELSELSVVSNGEVKLETILDNNLNHYVINPNSVTTLKVAVKPLNFGDLKIVGVRVKVNNCESQFFKIISKEKYQVIEKIKKTGFKANLPADKNKIELIQDKMSRRVEFKNLNLVVITPQPILSLIDLSLNNGWIMLLEGEKTSFKVLLKNLSNIKINYLAFSFLDSTIEPLTKALQNKDLPVNEIYEIEYYLLKRKPLRIQKSEMDKLKMIKPLDFLNLNFDIKGKRGMRDAQIILEYGNQAEGDEQKIKYSSFFRRISIPISMTVSPSVELAGCDLIPLFSNVNELDQDKITVDEQLSKVVADLKELELEQKSIWSYLNKRTNKISDYCLLVVDLRNSWNQKFKVTLNSSDFIFPTSEEFEMNKSKPKEEKIFITEDKDDSGELKDYYSISESIAPGHTERFILPIKRIEFSQEYLERSIPSLRNKQFVVQDNKYSKEEFKYIREAFWYRKELLRHIKGVWVEENSKREGYIELRGIRLSQRMVSVLRIEKIGIEMVVLNSNKSATNVNRGLYWEVEVGKFITIRTKIMNRSNYLLKGLIRHVPITSSTMIEPGLARDKKILFNGCLQYSITEGIEPGESKEFDLGAVILEKGEYEWGAIFDEQIFDTKDNIDLQHTQREPLFIRAI